MTGRRFRHEIYVPPDPAAVNIRRWLGYMKETTNNIEEKLIESFKTLVMKEPVEKITIKEIADGAGVIRTTFYYHFQDKYELVERIIHQNLVGPIMDLVNQKKVDEALLEIFTRLDEERAFYKRLSKMEGQNSFKEILDREISEGLQEILLRKGTGEHILRIVDRYLWLTPKFIADYYAQSFTYELITFLHTDPPATPQEATEVFDYVVRHSLNEAVWDWYLK